VIVNQNNLLYTQVYARFAARKRASAHALPRSSGVTISSRAADVHAALSREARRRKKLPA